MVCRINDFKYKDVVDAADGCRLGYVGDVELDTADARLTAIVIRGRLRLFGLLGREDDLVIPWEGHPGHRAGHHLSADPTGCAERSQAS